jgi:hypothetical protein
MARIMQTTRNAITHASGEWPKPSDSSLDSSDRELEIIKLSYDSEVEEFVEFDPMIEVEPKLKHEGSG